MAAPRKLSPKEEAAIIAWQAKYRQARKQLRELGTFADKAREYGVSVRTIHTIPSRERDKIRRCLGTQQEAASTAEAQHE